MAENSDFIYLRANLGAQLRRHVLPEPTYNNLGMIQYMWIFVNL